MTSSHPRTTRGMARPHVSRRDGFITVSLVKAAGLGIGVNLIDAPSGAVAVHSVNHASSVASLVECEDELESVNGRRITSAADTSTHICNASQLSLVIRPGTQLAQPPSRQMGNAVSWSITAVSTALLALVTCTLGLQNGNRKIKQMEIATQQGWHARQAVQQGRLQVLKDWNVTLSSSLRLQHQRIQELLASSNNASSLREQLRELHGVRTKLGLALARESRLRVALRLHVDDLKGDLALDQLKHPGSSRVQPKTAALLDHMLTHGSLRRANAQPEGQALASLSDASKTTEIDYGRFWQQAWASAQRARGSGMASQRDEAMSWPKIFIYDLPQPLSDWSPHNASAVEIFGTRVKWNARAFTKAASARRIKFEDGVEGQKELGEWWRDQSSARLDTLSRHVRASNHYGFAQALLYRIWNSHHYRTLDPAKADLFLIPVLSLPSRGYQIDAACKSRKMMALAEMLPHLNRQTAPKHILLLSKEHYEARECTGWWSNPRGLLKHVQRFSYSQILPPSEFAADLDYYGTTRQLQLRSNVSCETLLAKSRCPSYPNLKSVPYLGSVHWPTEASQESVRVRPPPWADISPRKYLMLLLGSPHHGDTRVRGRVWGQCRKYQDAHSSRRCNIQRYSETSLLMKAQSTFCLEPSGDSPFRRSITDDVAFGCIPVFFCAAQREAYSMVWGHWKHSASVLVNRTAFLRGEIDLHRLLSSVPAPLLELFRKTIAEHGRKFTISLEDDPGDMVHALLTGAVRTASKVTL